MQLQVYVRINNGFASCCHFIVHAAGDQAASVQIVNNLIYRFMAGDRRIGRSNVMSLVQLGDW